MITDRYFLSVLLLLCLYTSSIGQTPEITPGAEVRPRIIIDNGYGTPKSIDESTLVYISQRTRLNMLFEYKFVETYLSFQDVRLWGADDHYKSKWINFTF